jgi:hypothetical protein
VAGCPVTKTVVPAAPVSPSKQQKTKAEPVQSDAMLWLFSAGMGAAAVVLVLFLFLCFWR